MPGVLCLLAHPDDELFCAGLLALLSRRNVPLHLACLTRGEAGGQTHRANGRQLSLGVVREREMRCSAQALGAERLTFLGYPDPSPDNGLKAPPHSSDELAAEIDELITDTAPDLIVTHGSNGDYGHPAHALVHSVVLSSVAERGPGAPPMYSFNAFHPSLPGRARLNVDDWADVIVDVSSEVATKAAVLECHASQWSIFVGSRENATAFKSAIREYAIEFSREGYCCHWPVTEKTTGSVLTDCLGTSAQNYIETPKRTAWTNLLAYHYRAREYIKTGLRTLRHAVSG